MNFDASALTALIRSQQNMMHFSFENPLLEARKKVLGAVVAAAMARMVAEVTFVFFCARCFNEVG